MTTPMKQICFNCLAIDPANRPTFSQLSKNLKDIHVCTKVVMELTSFVFNYNEMKTCVY